MAKISKPCFCCGNDCCTDGAHADLLPDNAMVTLPDIVPSAYPTCTWTTTHTSTVKAGNRVGLNPVFVNIGASCDFGIWIRPKFTEKCTAGPPGQPCGSCTKDRTFLGGERFQGWWCESQPRGQSDGGYAPALLTGTTCTYVKMEWQVYVTYRPTSTSCTPPDALTCATGPNKLIHTFGAVATPTLTPGLFPLGSTGLFKVPRRCSWRLRFTNLVTMNLQVTGSFGTSNRNISGVMIIGAYSQHVDCQNANSHSLASSVIPGECTGSCVSSSAACCGAYPKCDALLETPFWYPVGSEVASTPGTNRSNPPPKTLSTQFAVVGSCRCAYDQYFQIDFYYRVAGRP